MLVDVWVGKEVAEEREIASFVGRRTTPSPLSVSPATQSLCLVANRLGQRMR